MAGNKTHEQQLRIFEGKQDVPKEREQHEQLSNAEIAGSAPERANLPPGEMGAHDLAGRRSGRNQESRDHNKHNHQTQHGHAVPKPAPEQEKD